MNKLPIVTCVILAISAFVALISKFGANINALQPFLISFFTQPNYVEINQGQYWRLFTPIFVHFGAAHLLFNGAMLWALGSVMEKVHKPLTYITIIAIIALASNVSQYHMSGPLFGGLSGVVYGLFAFAFLQQKLNPRYPIAINPQTAKALIIWFFICLSGVLEFVGVHVANTAHFVGIVAGVACSLIYAYLIKSSQNHH